MKGSCKLLETEAPSMCGRYTLTNTEDLGGFTFKGGSLTRLLVVLPLSNYRSLFEMIEIVWR